MKSRSSIWSDNNGWIDTNPPPMDTELGWFNPVGGGRYRRSLNVMCTDGAYQWIGFYRIWDSPARDGLGEFATLHYVPPNVTHWHPLLALPDKILIDEPLDND